MANFNMANQISAWCIHFVQVANQIHEELEKWLTISIFLFCSALRCNMGMPVIPGVSMRLILRPSQWKVTAADVIVIPLSRSWEVGETQLGTMLCTMSECNGVSMWKCLCHHGEMELEYDHLYNYAAFSCYPTSSSIDDKVRTPILYHLWFF